MVRWRKRPFRVLVWHARNHFTDINGLWEWARRIGIFITWELKEVHSITLSGWFETNFVNDLFTSQNAPQRSALWILFISSLLQNRSLVCSCPWDGHARRLPLRDDPKSYFKEDCTILFLNNETVEIIIFWSISFLKNTCLWLTLRRNANCLTKISLIFTTKIY